MSWTIDWDLELVGGVLLGIGFGLFYFSYCIMRNQDEMKKYIKNILVLLRKE